MYERDLEEFSLAVEHLARVVRDLNGRLFEVNISKGLWDRCTLLGPPVGSWSILTQMGKIEITHDGKNEEWTDSDVEMNEAILREKKKGKPCL